MHGAWSRLSTRSRYLPERFARIESILKRSEIMVIPDPEFALDEFPESLNQIEVGAVRWQKYERYIKSAAIVWAMLQR